MRNNNKNLAIAYTEVYMIRPEDSIAISQKYPETLQVIRYRVAYFALRRELVWLANHMRAAR